MSFRNPVTCLLCPYFQQEKPVMNLMHKCYLPPEIHELVCTDELDKTAGTHRWNKKAANQLEKLNNDCNRTACVPSGGSVEGCCRFIWQGRQTLYLHDQKLSGDQPAGTSVLTKHNRDMAMGYLWLNGWSHLWVL